MQLLVSLVKAAAAMLTNKLRFTSGLLLFSVLPYQVMKAQENQASSNHFFVTAGGTGGFYTLSWQHRFQSSGILEPYTRIGFSGFAAAQRTTFVFPLTGGACLTKKRITYGAGIGLAPNFSYYYQEFSIGTNPSRFRSYVRACAELGIDYTFKNPKFSIGIAYTPLISYIQAFELQNWAGISFAFHPGKNK